MKRILSIILTVLTLSLICNAQISNPTVYVTENGTLWGTDGTGGYFANPITATQFMYNVNHGVYSGNITVRFAGGDYYNDFVFDNIPTNIQSIKMYGGWNPSAPINKRGYDDRDFYHYETRFYGTEHDDLVRFAGVGLYHPNGAGTCIIDGISFVGTGNTINHSALALYYGDHIISQCKFYKFSTSTWLIWMETANHTVTYTSCLFVQNNASHLMTLFTHVDLINVTIADNQLGNDMFIPAYSHNPGTQSYNALFNYNLYNSIIYGNSNMHMGYVLFNDVSNSILENNESWITNITNNYIGSTYDPLFNTYSSAPYSCDYYSSPAIGAGNAYYIYYSSFYDSDIMDYDVANMYRYYDFYALKTDIGAYQSGYDDGSHLYNAVGPTLSAPKRHIEASIEPDIIAIDANDIQTGAILTLYDISGKIIYTTSAENGLNAQVLNSGIYVAIVASKDGQEISSRKIVIP